MALKKVMQRHRQLGGVIAPPRFNRGTYIVEDHFADALRPTNLMKQIISQCRCRDFRYVLVLSDSLDLYRFEAANGDAVLQGDDGTPHWPFEGILRAGHTTISSGILALLPMSNGMLRQPELRPTQRSLITDTAQKSRTEVATCGLR